MQFPLATCPRCKGTGKYLRLQCPGCGQWSDDQELASTLKTPGKATTIDNMVTVFRCCGYSANVLGTTGNWRLSDCAHYVEGVVLDVTGQGDI